MEWTEWAKLVIYFLTPAVPFLMLLVVPRGRKPSSAIAWLLVIAIFPWFGLFFFLLLGNPRLPRQRRRRQREMEALVRGAIKDAMDDPLARPWIGGELAGAYAGIGQMGSRLGALPPFQGNRVDVLGEYEGVFSRLVTDIDAATRFVHVQYYILAQDQASEPVLAAMERAVARGVKVRVLLDHLGSRAFRGHRALLRRLRRAGIDWRRMLPIAPWRGQFARPDLRNHRKIVVVDGAVGYAGSQNLIDRRYRKRRWSRTQYHYLDIVARMEGPIVQQLDAIFRMDWYAETGKQLEDTPVQQALAGDTMAQVLPSGPGHQRENNLRVFNALLYRARERIVIVSAYFVPDETLMMALTSAAQRGIDVTLVTPARSNQFLLRHAQRSFYGELLEAGVKVFLHPRPWNLHSKTMSLDDQVCVIGSSNLDIRSFVLNLEVSLICYDPTVVSQLQALEQRYIAESNEISLKQWQRTPVWRLLMDNIARLTSALQ